MRSPLGVTMVLKKPFSVDQLMAVIHGSLHGF